MFSSAHILFLLSLGVFTWAILCYFQAIVTQVCPPREILRQRNYDCVVSTDFERGMPSTIYGHTFQMYAYFLGVCVCFFAMTILAHTIKCYLAKQMYTRLCAPKAPSLEVPREEASTERQEPMPKRTEQEYRPRTHRPQTQHPIEARCSACNARKGNPLAVVPIDRSTRRNIFISNPSICFNQQFHIHKRQSSSRSHALGGIWQEYLHSQRRNRTAPFFMWANIKADSNVVLTTEQLQKLHGFN